MTKLKPMEQLVIDAKVGDIILFHISDYQVIGFVDQVFPRERDSLDEPERMGYIFLTSLYGSSNKRLSYAIDTLDENYKGYEILRRAKTTDTKTPKNPLPQNPSKIESGLEMEASPFPLPIFYRLFSGFLT